MCFQAQPKKRKVRKNLDPPTKGIMQQNQLSNLFMDTKTDKISNMTINKLRAKSANLKPESKLKIFSGEGRNFCKDRRICTALSDQDLDPTTTSKAVIEIWQPSCKSVYLHLRKLQSNRKVWVQFLKKKMWPLIYPPRRPSADSTKLIWWKKRQLIFLQA